MGPFQSRSGGVGAGRWRALVLPCAGCRADLRRAATSSGVFRPLSRPGARGTRRGGTAMLAVASCPFNQQSSDGSLPVSRPDRARHDPWGRDFNRVRSRKDCGGMASCLWGLVRSPCWSWIPALGALGSARHHRWHSDGALCCRLRACGNPLHRAGTRSKTSGRPANRTTRTTLA